LGAAYLLPYGPEADDFYVVFPTRHTGYLEHDPLVQQALYNQTVLSYVFLEKMEFMLEEALLDRGAIDPMNTPTEERRRMFFTIRDDFNKQIRFSDLWLLYKKYETI
jgi:hypothetical protein